MILYGASGHGKVIISCLRALGETVRTIFDDDLSKTILCEIPVSGVYEPNLFPTEKLVIAIGNNQIREHISAIVKHQFGIVIHPSSIVDESVLVGEGTVIMHRSVVQVDSQIGRHVIINTMASVDHECMIGDFAHIAPGVTLCGNVKVGKGTLIGAGSVVLPNITIGDHCVVSAGSVVKHDIPDGMLVKGSEPKIISNL